LNDPLKDVLSRMKPSKWERFLCRLEGGHEWREYISVGAGSLNVRFCVACLLRQIQNSVGKWEDEK
jgi:hypothetical protein